MRPSTGPRIALLAIALILTLLVFGSPAGRAPDPLGAGYVHPLEAAVAVPPDFAVGPDTTAKALWAHLKESDYRANWKLWPGKGRLYEGTEPHGMLLTTYTNGVAHEALVSGKLKDLPAGSIIVKENFMPDSTFAAATVMMKVPGYDADHQDWLFAKFDPEGTAEAFGRVPMCQSCHGAAPGGSYVYTPVGR